MKEHKKLERLMLFSEVAQHLSFTQAAQQLDISRGHLSSQVRQLEKEMGLALLIRSTRSVRLTTAGARVLDSMHKIRHDILNLERNVEREGLIIEGLIKVTAPALFSECYLLDIFTKFTQIHPAVSFSIESSYKSHDLNTSNFDLAFRATNLPPENMLAKKLFAYQHRCCASPAYFERYGIPTTTHELINHQCLKGKDQPQWLFNSGSVEVSGRLEINDNHLLKGLALKGAGIVRVPEYLVETELKNGELTAIFADDMPQSLSIYMIHPQLIHQSARLTAFIEFTRQYFSHYPTIAD